MSVDLQDLPYRPCVGIVLFNKDGKVFAGQRIDNQDGLYKTSWQFPQGGIDDGEDAQVAAFRELKEETGTDQAEIIKVMPQKTRYDLPDHLKGKIWGGQYRGQEQTWIAMRFTGNDHEINLDFYDEPEFSQWAWMNLADVLDVIVPFKRETYKQVIAAFSDIP